MESAWKNICVAHLGHITVGAARLLCNEVLAIKRQPRSGCRYTCTARSPKGPLGSTRHLAHIAGHIGLMHIGKEMVHSYREREREGRRAVASDLYMPGGKYFFLYIYLLTHSILFNHLSLTACYHKGAALLRHTPSILGWPEAIARLYNSQLSCTCNTPLRFFN